MRLVSEFFLSFARKQVPLLGQVLLSIPGPYIFECVLVGSFCPINNFICFVLWICLSFRCLRFFCHSNVRLLRLMCFKCLLGIVCLFLWGFVFILRSQVGIVVVFLITDTIIRYLHFQQSNICFKKVFRKSG